MNKFLLLPHVMIVQMHRDLSAEDYFFIAYYFILILWRERTEKWKKIS